MTLKIECERCRMLAEEATIYDGLCLDCIDKEIDELLRKERIDK